MSTPRLPALYLPHGGGPSFFMTGERKALYQPMEDFLRGVHRLLPAAPTAILIITAHWETDIPSFTGAPNPALVYDYYGPASRSWRPRQRHCCSPQVFRPG